MNKAEKQENNGMEKTTELFKKITDTKGTFLAKMGTRNHRNGKDLTEEESKKRWKEYTELYKKGLNDLDNHDGVITYLECVECEVHTHTFPGVWSQAGLSKHYYDQS